MATKPVNPDVRISALAVMSVARILAESLMATDLETADVSRWLHVHAYCLPGWVVPMQCCCSKLDALPERSSEPSFPPCRTSVVSAAFTAYKLVGLKINAEAGGHSRRN